MPKIYDIQDNGFAFKKASNSNLYHDTEKGFDFKRSNQSGLYSPSRNGFDFKRSGQPVGHELKRGNNEIRKAAGGAVTQAAMPAGPNQGNQMTPNNSRNNGNLPY